MDSADRQAKIEVSENAATLTTIKPRDCRPPEMGHIQHKSVDIG
jgi:hypothetical protein